MAKETPKRAWSSSERSLQVVGGRGKRPSSADKETSGREERQHTRLPTARLCGEKAVWKIFAELDVPAEEGSAVVVEAPGLAYHHQRQAVPHCAEEGQDEEGGADTEVVLPPVHRAAGLVPLARHPASSLYPV